MGSGTSSLEKRPKFVPKKFFEKSVDSNIRQLTIEERGGYGQGYRITQASSNVYADYIPDEAHEVKRKEALKVPIIINESSMSFEHSGEGYYYLTFGMKVVKSCYFAIFYGSGNDDDELGRPKKAGKMVGPYVLIPKNDYFIQPHNTSIGLDILPREAIESPRFVVLHVFIPKTEEFVNAYIVSMKVSARYDGGIKKFVPLITKKEVIYGKNQRSILENAYGLNPSINGLSQRQDIDNDNNNNNNNIDDESGNKMSNNVAGANNNVNCDNSEMCSICFTNPSDTMLLPCRHVCLCSECAEEYRFMGKAVCPICREPVAKMETIVV